MSMKITLTILVVASCLGACSMMGSGSGSGAGTPPSASDNKTH